MGNVATLYRINPVKSANASAKEAARYRRNFRRGRRSRDLSAAGRELFCQRSHRDLMSSDLSPRFGQRVLLVHESRFAINSGQRLAMAARPLLHRTFVRRPALRNAAPTRTAICRARVRNELRISPGVTVASSNAETGSICDSIFFCWSGEFVICDDRNVRRSAHNAEPATSLQ